MLDNLGVILRIMRIANDYRIKEVAEITKFHKSYICDLECERKKGIRMKTLEKFADVYSFKVSEIFYFLEFYEKLKTEDKKRKYRLTLLHVLIILEEKEKITKNLE